MWEIRLITNDKPNVPHIGYISDHLPLINDSIVIGEKEVFVVTSRILNYNSKVIAVFGDITILN